MLKCTKLQIIERPLWAGSKMSISKDPHVKMARIRAEINVFEIMVLGSIAYIPFVDHCTGCNFYKTHLFKIYSGLKLFNHITGCFE